MALGGFNPNKYLGPSAPQVAFTPNGQFGYQQAIPPHMMGYQGMYQQNFSNGGMPPPVQSFIPGQGPQVSGFNGAAKSNNGKTSPSKNGQRYEKKDK